MCTSLGDLFGKLTVVPAFTLSTFGRNASSVVFPPTPIATVFGATFVDGERAPSPFAQPAFCSTSACAFTWSGVFGTAAPAGLTTTRRLHPRVERADELEAARLRERVRRRRRRRLRPLRAQMPPLDAGAFPEIVFGPNGPNAAGL